MESRWLISYTPGPWIVLAGPKALVAVDSGLEPYDDLVADLWAHVGAGIGMRELVGHLARIEYARLPRLAVVFFESPEGEGLRALLRGPVRVLSKTGQTIAHGEDVLTWQEVRLAALDRIELDLGTSEGQSLPLVQGGVRAGRLRFVNANGAPGSAPTSLPVEFGSARFAASAPPDGPEPPPPAATVPQAADPEADDTLPPRATPSESSDSSDSSEESSPSGSSQSGTQDETADEMEDADTELMVLPPFEMADDPPAIARLRAPDGSTVDLDRAVLIGRAPSDAGFENAQPHLLTVLSPSQDISRTHVLVAPEGDGIVVTDLHSTNGTTVVRPGPGVEREALPSGQSVRVEIGTVLELGDEVAIMVDAAAEV